MKIQDKIIAILKQRPIMTRGKLSVKGVRKSGAKAYNLQYHRQAKYFVRSVASDEVSHFEQATENYRVFMELVQQYIDEETQRGIQEIEKEVLRERRKTKKAK